MGMTANQLLSKALSTGSEDEAIACLKMVRKKGLKLEEDAGQLRDKLAKAMDALREIKSVECAHCTDLFNELADAVLDETEGET